MLKAQEIKSLRIRNSSLETMISSLDKRGLKSDSSASPKIVDYPEISFNRKEKNTNNELCELDFEAVVTALNGKSKEAFYTEFFLIKNDIETALRNGGINLKNYSGVDSYSELWARSRKNAFLFPGVQKEIRSVFLALVEEGEGKRIRTDVDGAARFSNIAKGNYFVIGTASLGKVGVTWSVPVTLDSGSNKISLTLANCSWSL